MSRNSLIQLLLITNKPIHKCKNANNKYMKDHDKNKESLYLKFWDVSNLYDWVMSQKLPVNKFE